MGQVFSFRYVCENKISKVRMATMPGEQHLELEFDNAGEYVSPAKWVIGEIYYNLPLRSDTINPDLECFAYADNEETFGDYVYNELMDKIREVKNQRTFKRY